MDNINELMGDAEKLKKQIFKDLTQLNIVVNKASKEEKTEIAPIMTDINKMINMMKLGEYNEDFINQMQLKYADKNSK